MVLLLLVVLTVAIAVPAYVSSDSAKRLILARANASGAGALDFANLSMSWLRGINISRISFKDSSQSVSVAVKGFSTKPNYGAILTGNLSLGRTVIDEPRVEINVEKMKQKSAAGPKAGGGAGQAAGIPIQRIDLVVKNGDVKIKGAEGAVEISQINSSVNLRPEGEQTEFELGARVAGDGKESTITAKGQVKPGANWNLKRTSADVAIEVNNLGLSQLESILAIAGVDINAGGTVSGNVKAAMKNGVIENVDVNVKGNALEITTPQLKGDTIKTGVLDVAARMGQQGDLVNVEKLTVQTDWLKADANGTVPMSLGSLEDFLKPDSKYELKGNLECDIPAIAAQLPKTLGLKEGTKLTAGGLVGSVQTLTEQGVKKLSGQVSIEGLAGTVNGRPVSIAEPISAEALITSEGKEIKFEKAVVASTFASVTCSGTSEAFNYTAQADLAKLSSEIGQFADIGKYKLSGQLSGKGQISNNKNTTMVVSSANIANLSASPTADITITEPNASVDIMAAFDKATKVLLVKQFKADTSLGQFSVKDGRLPFGKETKEPMSLTASARNVDLARLQPYLVMTKTISKDVQLGGVAESDVTLGSENGTYHLTTESTKIANLLVKSPGKAPFTQSTVAIALDAEVSPTMRSYKADIISPDIKIKTSVRQEVEGPTSSVEGNAQLDYDWKAISGILSAFMPAGLTIEGKRKDTINFSSRYPTGKTNAMLANLNTQAKIGFDKADYMGLNIGETAVDIKVDKGFLTISPFTTTVNNGQFNFGGSADFKQKPALFRTPGPMTLVKNVQLNDEMMNKLLGRINPVFSGSVNASGIANFDCSQMAFPITGGRPEDVDITGTVSLTQVKMQPTGLLGAILTAIGVSGGQTMTIHPTAFTAKNGFVRYQNMQMDIGNTPINFAGSVPLDPDRKIENFSVVLPVTVTGERVETGKETGTSRVTAYIKGTPKHPKLDLGKTVQQELIQTGLELLKEKAKKK